MTEAQIDQVFWGIAAALAAFVLLFPNGFIYLASYGRRIDYKPSAALMIVVRACAGLMLFGILWDLFA